MTEERIASSEDVVRAVQIRLRKIRDNLNLKQEELANLLDVSRQTIVNWETKPDKYKMSGKDFLAVTAIIEMKISVNPGIKSIIQAILDAPAPETEEPSPKIDIGEMAKGAAKVAGGAVGTASLGSLLGAAGVLAAGPIGAGLAGAWFASKLITKKKKEDIRKK